MFPFWHEIGNHFKTSYYFSRIYNVIASLDSVLHKEFKGKAVALKHVNVAPVPSDEVLRWVPLSSYTNTLLVWSPENFSLFSPSLSLGWKLMVFVQSNPLHGVIQSGFSQLLSELLCLGILTLAMCSNLLVLYHSLAHSVFTYAYPVLFPTCLYKTVPVLNRHM